MLRTIRMSILLAAVATVVVLAAVPLAAQAAYPRACGSLRVTGGTFSSISTTKVLTCSWGRDVLRAWKSHGFTSRKVADGRGASWACSFDRSGRKSGRGTCISGKNGGVAFSYKAR